MFTTLNQIRTKSPCSSGWKMLLASLNKTQADDVPINISTILDSNGLDDALWCLRTVKGRDKELRLYAVWCARQVQHLMTDKRSLDALDVAERFAIGDATQEELTAARVAAACAGAAYALGAAAWCAAWAARNTADSSNAAADAAWAAASSAGAATGAAIGAAWYDSWAAARAADPNADSYESARDAARDASNLSKYAQEARLRELCSE